MGKTITRWKIDYPTSLVMGNFRFEDFKIWSLKKTNEFGYGYDTYELICLIAIPKDHFTCHIGFTYKYYPKKKGGGGMPEGEQCRTRSAHRCIFLYAGYPRRWCER